jgi:hypothetical protein
VGAEDELVGNPEVRDGGTLAEKLGVYRNVEVLTQRLTEG